MKNKILSILLSIVVAFGLWVYVIYNVSPESEATIYDIPITAVGESVLNERGLMVTAWSATSVDLTLSGNRSDLNELTPANITLKVDLSTIYEAGVHTIEYTTSYPGSVAANSFTRVSQYPETVTVTVEKRDTKEVPVQVVYDGTTPDGYVSRKGDIVLDYENITVTGPASVVEQITQAVITIELTDQAESISQSYRYTLCDSEGNPVDSELITVNVEEVHVDLTIHRIKVVELAVNIVDGGGATSETTTVTIDPVTIQVSGSDAALELVGDTITLGTINLAEYAADTELVFTIPTFEGVTNDSGVTEATVSLNFANLRTKEIVLESFTAVNVPEGYQAEIITEKLTVTVRGTAALISALTAENITATVDFSGAELGAATYRVTLQFAEGFESLGVLGRPSVTANVLADDS